VNFTTETRRCRIFGNQSGYYLFEKTKNMASQQVRVWFDAYVSKLGFRKSFLTFPIALAMSLIFFFTGHFFTKSQDWPKIELTQGLSPTEQKAAFEAQRPALVKDYKNYFRKRFRADSVVFASFISVILLFFCKLRKTRIFFSYKAEYLDFVMSCKRDLERQRFKVLVLPFQPRDHDQTVLEVREMLKKSDIMLVMPSVNQKSFVDAEILSALVTDKPVVILKHSAEQKLPDTAFVGLPVFNLDKLSAQNFHPLYFFIRRITGNRLHNFYLLGLMLLPFTIFHHPFNFSIADNGFSSLDFWAFSFFKSEYAFFWEYNFLCFLLFWVFSHAVVATIVSDQILKSIARQARLTGKNTKTALHRAFSMRTETGELMPENQRILDCLEDTALETRY